MSDVAPIPSQIVTELKVSAHLMRLDAGVYCVSHAPGATPPDPETGLPGARISVPPGVTGRCVTISGFNDDGWLGALDSAALIHITDGPAQVLMTVYQHPDSKRDAPRLQVTKLGGPAAPAAVPAPQPALPQPVPTDAEIAAHIQQRGDVVAKIGDWVGTPGSQRWIEGFSLTPKLLDIAPEDIEYQAVLGRGWLSPWGEGGQYCGSRGMALPILGLRVRLRGKAAAAHSIQVSATFTDGTAVGPVGPGDACEAESLAPLEAFRVTIEPVSRARPAPPADAVVAAPEPAKPAATKPAAKTPAAKTSAAKTPAAKTPAAKNPAAKTAAKATAKPAPAKTGAAKPSRAAPAAVKPPVRAKAKPPARRGR